LSISGEAKLRGALCDGWLINIRDDFQNEPARLIAKNQGNVLKLRSKGFADETDSNQANPCVTQVFAP
jgi:hypothetical protein